MSHENSSFYNRIAAITAVVGLGVGAAACAEGKNSLSTGVSNDHNALDINDPIGSNPMESLVLPTSGAVEVEAAAGVHANDSDAETSTTISPDFYAELKDLFTVNADDITFECTDEGADSKAITVKTLEGSETKYVIPKQNYLLPVDETKTDDDHKKWSDSFAPPVIADITDKDAALVNVEANDCEDVFSLFSHLNFIANMPLPGGVRVADLNPAFAKFAIDPSEVNELATFYITAINNMASPNDFEAYNEVIADAQLLAGVMAKFQNAGVQVANPTSYQRLKNLGQEVNTAGVPELEVVNGTYGDNPNTATVENEFIVMKGMTKANGCVVEWGINLNDMKFATLTSDECAPVAPPVSVPRNPVPPTNGSTPPTAAPGTTVPETTEVPPITTAPSTTAPGTTAPSTTIPGTTSTTARPEVTAPASTVIEGPGAGGEPDPDNNPNNNTSVVTNPTTTSQPAPGETTPTTVIADPTQDTTPAGTWNG